MCMLTIYSTTMTFLARALLQTMNAAQTHLYIEVYKTDWCHMLSRDRLICIDDYKSLKMTIVIRMIICITKHQACTFI